MTDPQFQVLRGAAFVIAAATAVVLQRLTPHANSGGSLRTNVGLWFVNVLVMAGVCGACACAVSRWAAHAGFGVLNVGGAPPWIAVVTSVIALDFVSYVWHRANHRVPLLWRFHRVHHSDMRFTASTAVRFHPLELMLSLPLRLSAVAILGAPASGVVAFEALFAVANLIEHGDIGLPASLERRLSRLLVVPALHRFHHTRTAGERDHNFGTILIVWDRVLGTFRPSSSQDTVNVGLPDVQEPLTVRGALLLPLHSR